MNTRKLLMAMAAIAAVAAGCSKEELEGGSESGQEKVAMSFSSEALTTRTSLVDGQKVVWTEDDAIGIFGGSAAVEEFVLTEIDPEDASRATFRGEAVPSDTYYAIYPFNPEAAIEGNVISTELPSGQPAEAGTFGTGINLSAAVAAQDNTLTFRNLCGLVTVELSSVPEGYELEGLVLEGRNGEKLAGQVSITADGAGLNAAPAESSSTAVTLKAADGAPLAAGTYVFTILPADFTGGLRIVFDYGESGRSEVLTGEPVKVSAGENHRLPAVSAKAPEGTAGNPYRISTADELLAFAAASGEYSSDDVVALDADIDMSGKAWTPFVLGCQFDGRGHRIYNISSDAGCIFTDISSGAVLKDVVFGSRDGTAYDGTSVISLSGPSENTGLVGRNSGTLDNVTSYVPVTAEYSGEIAGNEVRIGGLVSSNYGTVRNSRAHGKITVTGTINKYVYAGGITGWFSSSGISVESSVNTGDITVNSDKLQGVGGIAGMFQGGKITDCENTGKITVTNADKGSYCGGIVGFIQIRSESPSTISGCENSGEFDMDNDDVRGLGGIAGVIHGYAQSGVTISGCTNSSPVFISKGHRNLSGDKGIGGILGLSTSSTNKQHRIVSCTNSGAVYYKDNRGLTAIDDVTYTTAGGIAGILVEQMEVTDCINTGDVSSDMASNNNIGGIAGLMWNTTKISGCTNSGNVTLDFEVGTAESPGPGVRAGIGGIAGLMRGSSSLEGNTNDGAVSMTLRNIGNHCSAGGMAGVVEGSITLADNINNGAVSSDVAQTYKSVGGIVGHVMQSLTMTRNENYGDVTAESTLTSDVFAGGLIGHIDSGSASVPTVADCTECVSNSDVTSPVRAGALFAILFNSEYSSGLFKDCRIGGTVTGQVFDASLGTGAHTITAENLSGCAKSYVGGNATYSETNLQLAE